MAPSLRSLAVALIQLNTLTSVALAATVTYDFNVSWVDRDPLGSGSRKVMGINGQWPIPTVKVNMGDRLIVNLHNQMDAEVTSLHWHGLFQNGTTHMDGAAGVSQCGVPPGGSFTYNFTVDQPGTYWYHSHVRGQYPDGLRGPLIVHDTSAPFKYDEEIVMTLSDWYNDKPSELLSSFISYANPTGAEPIPDGALLNDTQNLTVSVQPGKTYLFRFANIGAFASQYLWFEGHNMSIVEVDGVYTQPQDAEMIYITAAQRYAALITMKNDTSTNFAINAAMDTDLFDSVPDGLNTNVTGWLVYNDKNSNPDPTLLDDYSAVFDDFTLQPLDNQTLLDKVDYSMTLNLTMDNLGDGANYAFFNDVTYVAPKVPTLYTAMTTGAMSTNVEVYGDNTNAFVLKKGDVVEIVVNNMDTGKHPFHIHGHNVQVVFRPDDNSGTYDPTNATFSPVPMRRDTVWVKPTSNMVLRFTADNPGVWLFHCHLEWHMASGLIATLIESPTSLQQSLTIPQSHYDTCKSQNILTAGNAAGNTVDLLDLSGENKSPDPLPAGFTARGIVALVFSCISAFLGMGVIGWYGSRPMTERAADKIKAVVVGGESRDELDSSAHGQPMVAKTQ